MKIDVSKIKVGDMVEFCHADKKRWLLVTGQDTFREGVWVQTSKEKIRFAFFSGITRHWPKPKEPEPQRDFEAEILSALKPGEEAITELVLAARLWVSHNDKDFITACHKLNAEGRIYWLAVSYGQPCFRIPPKRDFKAEIKEILKDGAKLTARAIYKQLQCDSQIERSSLVYDMYRDGLLLRIPLSASDSVAKYSLPPEKTLEDKVSEGLKKLYDCGWIDVQEFAEGIEGEADKVYQILSKSKGVEFNICGAGVAIVRRKSND